MKILLLSNGAAVAHGSIPVFEQEISEALNKMGHEVVRACCVEESLLHLKSQVFDFSISIGRYSYYFKDRPLYDVMRLRHYQWLIDNPFKYEFDTLSELVKYIVIDPDHLSALPEVRQKALFIPLGVPECGGEDEVADGQKNAIVFPGQVRDYRVIWGEIRKSRNSKLLEEVVDYCVSKIDNPFQKNFNEISCAHPYNLRKMIFGPVNSFLRAYKRENVLSRIMGIPICIIGEVQPSSLRTRNDIVCLGEMGYLKALSMMRKYAYTLHIEPNFCNGIHDRVLRAIGVKSCPLVNEIDRSSRIFKDAIHTYRYAPSKEAIELKKERQESRMDRIHAMKEVVMKSFTWHEALGRVVADFQQGES